MNLSHCFSTVPENIGKFPIRIVRSGRTDSAVSVRYNDISFHSYSLFYFENIRV